MLLDVFNHHFGLWKPWNSALGTSCAKKGFQFTDFISLGDEFQQNPMVKAGNKKTQESNGMSVGFKTKKMVIEMMIYPLVN